MSFIRTILFAGLALTGYLIYKMACEGQILIAFGLCLVFASMLSGVSPSFERMVSNEREKTQLKRIEMLVAREQRAEQIRTAYELRQAKLHAAALAYENAEFKQSLRVDDITVVRFNSEGGIDQSCN